LTSLPLSMCLMPTKKALAQSPICDRAGGLALGSVDLFGLSLGVAIEAR